MPDAPGLVDEIVQRASDYRCAALSLAEREQGHRVGVFRVEHEFVRLLWLDPEDAERERESFDAGPGAHEGTTC